MKKVVKNLHEFIKMNEKVSSLYEEEGRFDYTPVK